MSDILPPGQPGQPQGARLSEEEAKTVARLLSDPTYFPVEFRAWIKAFIESSGITLPASQIKGGGTGARTGLPAGVILPYPASALPPDTLACDGRAVGRTDHKKIFDIIGVNWGAGDGVTTFNIPDFRDRALYGAGSVLGLASTDGLALGQRGGPAHFHTFSGSGSGSTDWEGDHQHDMYASGHGASDEPNTFQSIHYLGYEGGAVTNPNGGHDHGVSVTISGNTSGGYAQDRPSYATVIYVITTGL